MTVTRSSQALGSWSIKLRPGTPQHVIDSLVYFGHCAVSVGRPDPRVEGDGLLDSARYVGVLRKLTYAGEGVNLSGAGMDFWLGDENKTGPQILDQLLFTDASFTGVVAQLLGQTRSLRAGTLHSVTGAYVGYHQYVTIREALSFVCSTMTSDASDPVTWRVNGDGTLDAGLSSQLYPTFANPTTVIARRAPGVDMSRRVLSGRASVDEDVSDYATSVVLLGQGEGLGIASAKVDLDPAVIPYRDLFGNPVSMIKTVSQSSTDAANSLVQAQIALDQSSNPVDQVSLGTDEFDVVGDLDVGDAVWVYDPDASLEDTSPQRTEVIFRGERIYPVRLAVSEVTWPVANGMSVAYRGPDGAWMDLTDYVVWESGETSLTVGGYDRSLTNPTGRQEALGSRAAPNTSVPDTPEFVLPFVQAIYQSAQSGVSKSQVQVRWVRPDNVDGTPIIDGDHYEVRFRSSTGVAAAADPGTLQTLYPGAHTFPGTSTYPGGTLVGGSAAVIPPGFPSTWAQVAGKKWNELSTWAHPIEYVAGPWATQFASFDQTSVLVHELTPATTYEFQIRAVDNAVPPNYSAWSDSQVVTTNGDTIPPPTPASAEVAASMIAVQITHTLGAATGGTFNLPADLHHLEVHGQYEPTFAPDETTLLGKLSATNGMILSQTPVVGTLAVASTADIYIKIVAVDESGNRSNPSAPTQSTAALIDNEHISNLEVSKVTAGTITSDWLVGANIQTAPDGARAGMNAQGLFAYTALNAKSWEVQDATGDMVFYSPAGLATMRCEASTGNVYLYGADGTTPALTLTATTGLVDMIGRLTAGQPGGGRLVMDPAYSHTSPTGSVDTFPTLVIYGSGSIGPGRLNAVDSGAATAVGLNSGPSTVDSSATQSTMLLFPTSYRASVNNGDGQTRRGGYLDCSTGHAELGYAPADSALTSVYIDNGGLAADGPNDTKAYLNADGSAIFGGAHSGFVSFSTSGSAQLVSGGTVKSFVIDHPNDGPETPADERRYLVHGCVEGPTAGVAYHGRVTITDHLAVVKLPDYVDALIEPESAEVRLQPYLTTIDGRLMVPAAAPSPVQGGWFHIMCAAPDGTQIGWSVYATRRGASFPVEPLRSEVEVAGDGPYRYLLPEAPRPGSTEDPA